jgi:hypothetical protein
MKTPGRPSYQLSPGHPIPNDITNPDANLIYVYDGIFQDQADVDKNTLDYTGVWRRRQTFSGQYEI